MSESIPDQEFHVGLKAFIYHLDKILIVRSNPRGVYASTSWGLPGGKINSHEKEAPFEATLTREIEEELGPAFKASIGHPFCAWKYIRPNKPPILLLGFECKYLSGDIALSEEFDTHAWLDRESVQDYTFLPGHEAAIASSWKKCLVQN